MDFSNYNKTAHLRGHIICYRVFPGGKERPGRGTDPSPPFSAVVMKEWSYTTNPPVGRTACTEPQCLYKGDLYLYLYTYRLKGLCSVLLQGKKFVESLFRRRRNRICVFKITHYNMCALQDTW